MGFWADGNFTTWFVIWAACKQTPELVKLVLGKWKYRQSSQLYMNTVFLYVHWGNTSTTVGQFTLSSTSEESDSVYLNTARCVCTSQPTQPEPLEVSWSHNLKTSYTIAFMFFPLVLYILHSARGATMWTEVRRDASCMQMRQLSGSCWQKCFSHCQALSWVIIVSALSMKWNVFLRCMPFHLSWMGAGAAVSPWAKYFSDPGCKPARYLL